MILFSTLSSGNVLWLFCYLGFLSGIVFLTIFKASNYLSTHRFIWRRHVDNINQPRANPQIREKKNLSLAELVKQKKREKKEKLRQAKLEEKRCRVAQKRAKKAGVKKLLAQKQKNNKKLVKEKVKKEKRLARTNKFAKAFSKLKLCCERFIIFLKKTFATIISLVALAGVITTSLYINYNLNFGEVGLTSIAIYIFGFFLSSKFVKTLANFALYLYNKGKRRVNEKTI